MTVHVERMRANLELTHGALFSQRALTALVESGMTRDDAYRLVQEAAQGAWDTGTPFRELLAERGAGARPRRGARPGRLPRHVPERDRAARPARGLISAARTRSRVVPPRGREGDVAPHRLLELRRGGPQLDRREDRLDRDPHLELGEGGADAAAGAAAERDPRVGLRAASPRKRSGRNANGSG